nr:mannonate dehydratase [Eubacterium sp.]
MDMTLRWYVDGNYSVTFYQIRQIPGVAGVITAFHDIPSGEAWTYEDLI